MRMVESTSEDQCVAERWMREYLTREHEELGREGAVCPFVGPAREAGAIRTESLRAEPADGTEELVGSLRDRLQHFRNLPVPEGKESLTALVVLIQGLPRHRWRLLDAAQRRLKREAVREGLMVGQFHPDCPEPAHWNPSFAVSRSPLPLVAVRHMAFHDILFLHTDPVLFAEYRRRFASRYEDGGKVPQKFRTLYEGAPRLPAPTGNSYIDYQSVTLLHALHQPRTELQAESSFYLAGQAKELLFSLVLGEVRAAQEGIAADDLGRSSWHVRRATAGFRLLGEFWELLSTLSPAEFHSFRDALGDASGSGSSKYRELEFALGIASPSAAVAYEGVPGVETEVYRALHDASLYDDALGLLVRRGLLSSGALEPDRDVPAIRDAWAGIHREETVSGELLRWAEALMDLAQAFGRWRWLHLLTVERIIGYKPGTGGTTGVAWLRHVASQHAFPELWEARSFLEGGPIGGCPASPRSPFDPRPGTSQEQERK
ncbi:MULTISPECIES: tryptophan 2,3-dioxygenase family protein [unclassified Streptomyces]|uniref:tryptophan 2,3-dioxygenase family protein n=1 Tax=unclassified Streptomyces TaxID=2593676 RepID=UPI00380E06A0